MTFLNPTFEVPITKIDGGNLLLRHRFLLCTRRAEIRPADDRIVMTASGPFSDTRKEGLLSEAVLRIEPEDMGGPSLQLRSGCVATLMLSGQRFVLTRQYDVEYVDQYVDRLMNELGPGLRIERTV